MSAAQLADSATHLHEVNLTRVALTRASLVDRGGWSDGSGYLIAPDVVLTAAHVVEGTDQLEVRAPFREDPAETGWRRADVDWLGRQGGDDPDGLDLALLRARAPYASMPVARFAHPGRAPGRVACSGLGFPTFKERRERGVLLRDTVSLEGDVVIGEDQRLGLWHVALARPELPAHLGAVPDHVSPWSGVSGAAVLCGGCIVGVVRQHVRREGSLVLRAEPIQEALANPSFATAVVGEARPLRWDDPWGVLQPPYKPLSADDALSPATLLRPEFGVVPFRGRDDERAELRSWIDSEDRFAGWLLHAAGGAGKTRLAEEVIDDAGRAGWLAGFLPRTAGVGQLAPLVRSGLPLLVVVDEAHTVDTDELAALLSVLAEREAASSRLLLLARTAGEWFDPQLRSRRTDDVAIERALAKTSSRALGTLEPDVDGRLEAFCDAATSFAEVTGMTVPESVPPHDLSDEAFQDILLVHLAALDVVLGGADVSRSGRDELLDWLLDRERRYWERVVSGLPSDVSPARLVALQVLAGGAAFDAGAARDLLQAVPDLEGVERRILSRADDWLRELYPGDGRWAPLRPDLVADHLVAHHVDRDEDFPELLRGLTVHGDHERIGDAVAVLCRVARSHSEAGRAAVLILLGADPHAVLPVALAAAPAVGDPLGRIIDEHLGAHPDPELALRLKPMLPEGSIALREAAVTITRQALGALPSASESPETVGQRADMLMSLSCRLSALGGYGRRKALPLADEAVGAYRNLVATARHRYATGLAESLIEQARCLSALAIRGDDAVSAVAEAVQLYRADAGRNGEPSARRLVRSLQAQASVLDNLGRHRAALEAISEAVGVLEQVQRDHPDRFEPEASETLRAELADALATRAVCWSRVGAGKHALADIEAAAEHYRELAAARPDSFRDKVAGSLITKAMVLDVLGRSDDALTTVEESVRVYRELAAVRPDAFAEALAGSLVNRAGSLLSLDRPKPALESFEEAEQVLRNHVAPESDAYAVLAGTLGQKADLLDRLGDRERARATAQEGVERVLPLVERSPREHQISGRSLLQTYLGICRATPEPMDRELVDRLVAALNRGRQPRALK